MTLTCDNIQIRKGTRSHLRWAWPGIPKFARISRWFLRLFGLYSEVGNILKCKSKAYQNRKEMFSLLSLLPYYFLSSNQIAMIACSVIPPELMFGSFWIFACEWVAHRTGESQHLIGWVWPGLPMPKFL